MLIIYRQSHSEANGILINEDGLFSFFVLHTNIFSVTPGLLCFIKSSIIRSPNRLFIISYSMFYTLLKSCLNNRPLILLILTIASTSVSSSKFNEGLVFK